MDVEEGVGGLSGTDSPDKFPYLKVSMNVIGKFHAHKREKQNFEQK